MSHNIMKNDRVVYAGNEPWHKIGKKVEGLMTASEALIHANLGWKVLEKPVYDHEGREIKDYKSLLREDTNEVFHIAKKSYQIVQNCEAFSLFDEVIGTGMAKYEVAGSLKNGRRVWLLARVPSVDFEVLKNDPVRGYVLLALGHDGTLAVHMRHTPIRVVCWNTLSASLGEKSKAQFVFRHTKNYRNKTDEATQIFSGVRQYFYEFQEAAAKMAGKQMRRLEIDSFLDQLLKIDRTDEDEISTRKENQKNEIFALVENGRGTNIKGVRGSAWGVYNAVTEWVDHEKSTRKTSSNLESSWFGQGEGIREHAFKLLVK